MKRRIFISKTNKKVWRHGRHTPLCKIMGGNMHSLNKIKISILWNQINEKQMF